MNVIIQCPHCHKLLLRDIESVLRVNTFYCDCAGRGFKINLKMEIEYEKDITWPSKDKCCGE